MSHPYLYSSIQRWVVILTLFFVSYSIIPHHTIINYSWLWVISITYDLQTDRIKLISISFCFYSELKVFILNSNKSRKMSLDIINKRRALGVTASRLERYTTSDIFVIFLRALSAFLMIFTASFLSRACSAFFISFNSFFCGFFNFYEIICG